jgi:spore coat-associated protein N
VRGERRLRPLLVPVIALLAFASVAVADRGGRGGDPVATASDATGSLSISNSRAGGAILSAAGLAPGRSTSGEVTIRNSGTVPGGFSLALSGIAEAPGPGGGLLSQRVQLVVVDLMAPRTVYAGPFGALGSRDLGPFGPGEARTYRFTATLPDGGPPSGKLGGDNAYQGAGVRGTYVWTARELGTPEVTPLLLRVALVRRQPPLKRRKLVFRVRCNMACSLRATGRLARRGGRLRGKLKATASRRTKLTLRLSRRTAKRLAVALRRRGGTRMTLTVRARDASGRTTRFRRTVKLRQVRRGRRAQVRMTWQKR